MAYVRVPSLVLDLKKALFFNVFTQWATLIVHELRNKVIDSVQADLEMLDSIWQGQDADEFRNQVESSLLPQLSQLEENLLEQHQNIQQAFDAIAKADNRVQSLVDDLHAIAQRIY